jgi:hypothetical protein
MKAPAARAARVILASGAVVALSSAIAFSVAPMVDDDLKKALYTGAVTLIFGGLLGGVLKLLLEDVATARREREDAATFVTNVLADLKNVYDRVGRARLVIPAQQSAKTYGEEMRGLIDARVQLRNVMRALERRTAGVSETTRTHVASKVERMERYLEALTGEFRDKYKQVADLQRAYEARVTAALKQYAASNGTVSLPRVPNEPWDLLRRDFERLNSLIDGAPEYRKNFESALDDASEALRVELAAILAGPNWKSGHRAWHENQSPGSVVATTSFENTADPDSAS